MSEYIHVLSHLVLFMFFFLCYSFKQAIFVGFKNLHLLRPHSTHWHILLAVFTIFSNFVFAFFSASLPLCSSENNYNSAPWPARAKKITPSLAGRLKGFCRIGEKTNGDWSLSAFWESGHWRNTVTWWMNRRELAAPAEADSESLHCAVTPPSCRTLHRTWRTKKNKIKIRLRQLRIASQPSLFKIEFSSSVTPPVLLSHLDKNGK